MTISLLASVATFSGQLYFHFFTLVQSNYFDTTVNFSGQLFLQRSCFFLKRSFFRSVTSLQQLSFQNSYFLREISTEQALLVNRKFFMLVNFRNSYLFGAGIVQNRDIYRRATFSNQVLLHSVNFFRKTTFWKKLMFQNSNILHYLLLLESYLFTVATSSKKRQLVQQLPFQKNFCFTTQFFRRVTISEIRLLSKVTRPIYQLVVR